MVFKIRKLVDKMDLDMNKKVKEIFDYYKNEETDLSQSELVIALLTELQEAAGYLSPYLQDQTAKAAGVSHGYIAAVIRQLPHLHTRPFQYEIKVCISDRCKQKGSQEVLKELQRILKVRPGQVTQDGVFLLTTVYCMHLCTKGPNITINGTPYHNVTVENVAGILQNISSI